MTMPRPAASTWGVGDSRSVAMPGACRIRLARIDGSAMATGEPTKKTTPTPRQGGRVQRPGASRGLV